MSNVSMLLVTLLNSYYSYNVKQLHPGELILTYGKVDSLASGRSSLMFLVKVLRLTKVRFYSLPPLYDSHGEGPEPGPF